ncbi:MAG: ankyrin repeat domain-containing protein [Candidatus Aminicenantales bacterium]
MRKIMIWIFLAMIIFSAEAYAGDIHDAAKKGDLERVKALVAKDPECVSAKTERGTTPLHYACMSKNLGVVEFLIEKGADVNAQNDSLYVPLHYAAAYNMPEAINLLIKQEAKIEARSREEETPLHMAAASGAVEAAENLIQRGADLRAREARKRTPLVLAARESGSVEMAKLLIAHGSDINSVDESNDSALELASWRGFKDFVNLLLDKGAKISDSERQRKSLLNHSVKRRLERLLQALTDAGLDLKEIQSSNPELVLAAASGGSTQIIGMLEEHGFDLNYTDKNGWTPLHCAAEFGRNDAVRYLLSKGAKINARTVMGENAFNIARSEKNEETAALLKAAGADTSEPRFPELKGEYLGQERPGDTPVPFAPGIVCAHYGLHTSVAFSPDGKTAFWTIMIPPRESGYGTGRMLGTTLQNGRWTYPTQPEFKGGDVPFFSPDGKRLYFISRKPIINSGPGKENIWYVERTKTGWSEPQPTDPAVNSASMHWQFSVDRKGTFYIGSGAGRILVSQVKDGKYQNPVDFKDLYGSQSVKGSCPYISPEGDYLIFSKDDDLYITFRKSDGSWTEAQNLGDKINSRTYDLCPIVSPDGEYLFFITTRNNIWGTHWVSIKKTIEDLRKKGL